MEPSFDFTGEPAKSVRPRTIKPRASTPVLVDQYNPQYSGDVHRYTCEVCGETFPNSDKKNKHIRMHLDGCRNCNWCNKSFKNSIDRKVHMLTAVCKRLVGKVQQVSETSWKCTVCDAPHFNSEKKANNHARQHDSGQHRKCQVCGLHYPGKQIYGLVRHVQEAHPDYMASLGI